MSRSWAHSADLIAALIVILVTGHFGTEQEHHLKDQGICLVAIPMLAAVFVLITALQGPGSKSLVRTLILESDWVGILGKLSYAIYLFHEAIGDVYMQMAVKGYYQAWKGLVPPAGTPWWTKYQLYIMPWMSTQPFVLKFAAFSLSIVFGWIVSHYIIDIGLMAAIEYTGKAYAWTRSKFLETVR